MDVRHLELLRELGDRGSLAAVAAATHRTPSALSQQLRTAERAFGAALVEPHGRGVRLTEAGALLARGGVEVATALARVAASWDDYRGSPGGTVTLAALPSAATFLLPRLQQRLAGSGVELRCRDYDLAETDFAGLAQAMAAGTPTVLDVRRADERAAGGVRGSLHVPVDHLRVRLGRVPQPEVWVYSGSGYRASIAASILARAGYHPILVDGPYDDPETGAAALGLHTPPRPDDRTMEVDATHV